MKRIPLTQGKVAFVSDTDYPKVKNFKYYALHTANRWYAAREVDGTTTYLHIDLFGKKRGKVIDHWNGNGLDCTRRNIRFCTKKENFWNSNLREGRLFKGVRATKIPNRWVATICVHYEQKYLGYFKDPIDAAKAYNKAAKKYYGKFARLNEIPQ